MLDIRYSIYGLDNLVGMARQSAEIIKENHLKTPPQDDNLLAKNATSNLDLFIKELEKELALAQKVLGNSRKEALTEEVTRWDSLRDDNFIGLRMAAEAGVRRRRNKRHQQAAAYLDALFVKYDKSLHRFSLLEESVALKAIFEEVRANGQEELQGTEFEKWLAELEEDQKEFDKVYSQRGKEKAAKNLPTREEMSHLIKQAIDKIVQTLNYFMTANLLADLDKTQSELQELIGRVEKNL